MRGVHSVCALGVGRIVSGSYDKTLRVWDSSSGACLRVLEGHTSDVSSVCALGDGRIVSGSEDNTLRVWDSSSGPCLRVLERHTRGVLSVRALEDGCIVSGSVDKALRVWDSGTFAYRETVASNSPRAAKLLSAALPELPVSYGRTLAHCTLGGVSPLHLGADISCNALVTLPTGVRFIVAGTYSNAVHFLEIREPPAVAASLPPP